MKITRTLLAGSVVVLSLALAACGGGGGSGESAAKPPDAKSWQQDVKGGPIEVGVLPAAGTRSLKFLEEVAAGIEKDHPGADLKMTFANTKARPALEQRWRAGDGLDVDYTMFDGTNEALLEWADSGALLDLKPYLDQVDTTTGKPWLDQFSPAVLQFMQHPSTKKIYGVPSELSLQVLFYNAGLFKKHGITPPATWDDLTAAADRFKAAGVDPIAVTGLFEPYMGMWSDNIWLRTVGYDKVHDVLTEGKGNITDDPGFLKGLEMLQGLRDKNAFLKGFEGTDFTAAQAQFFQGKAGMILMGSWLVSEMADVIPKDFELGVLQFPAVTGGTGDQASMLATAQLMSVSAKSANIPLSLEWIRRVTSVETQTRRAGEIGEVSAVKGVSSPPGLPGISDVVAKADRLQASYYGLLSSKAKDVVYPEIAKLLFGKQDARQTLDSLDKGLRRVHGN
ncbi:putative ABC transporter extracellular-binding protein YurO [Sphaerisporangium siamense]|uniref:Raffinose/stachyose/melibiose transport system substrate-binding protein n=1 Tax=Sphaerisporangium siamense TaxID=795645 RepID=A0A7W7DDU7_9ACTN|nr:extracellular solute-binding protein [Sphaerisporangium siamense]MBB4704150.1 raffinose/stachyose/melibiose transport system substrate-binding protein [Sphaerisporangium siamense]GII85169.1 putative ABC transporter extracellular-binding protein YurO [Sphaerisporangium siamense]